MYKKSATANCICPLNSLHVMCQIYSTPQHYNYYNQHNYNILSTSKINEKNLCTVVHTAVGDLIYSCTKEGVMICQEQYSYR